MKAEKGTGRYKAIAYNHFICLQLAMENYRRERENSFYSQGNKCGQSFYLCASKKEPSLAILQRGFNFSPKS